MIKIKSKKRILLKKKNIKSKPKRVFKLKKEKVKALHYDNGLKRLPDNYKTINNEQQLITLIYESFAPMIRARIKKYLNILRSDYNYTMRIDSDMEDEMFSMIVLKLIRALKDQLDIENSRPATLNVYIQRIVDNLFIDQMRKHTRYNANGFNMFRLSEVEQDIKDIGENENVIGSTNPLVFTSWEDAVPFVTDSSIYRSPFDNLYQKELPDMIYDTLASYSPTLANRYKKLIDGEIDIIEIKKDDRYVLRKEVKSILEIEAEKRSRI